MTDRSMTALERAARAAWEWCRGKGTWLAERRSSRAMLMAEMAAALRALREPDEAMLEAMWAGSDQGGPVEIWQAAIDSILAGKPDTREKG